MICNSHLSRFNQRSVLFLTRSKPFPIPTPLYHFDSLISLIPTDLTSRAFTVCLECIWSQSDVIVVSGFTYDSMVKDEIAL